MMGEANSTRISWVDQLQINFDELFESFVGLIKTPNEKIVEQIPDIDPRLINAICTTSCGSIGAISPENINWSTIIEVLLLKTKVMDPVMMVVLFLFASLLLYEGYRILKWVFRWVTGLAKTIPEPFIPETPVSVCETLSDTESIPALKPPVHFPEEQRALLQFQRKSLEPTVFRYGFDYANSIPNIYLPDESTEELVRSSLGESHSPSPCPSPSPLPRHTLNKDECKNTKKLNFKSPKSESTNSFTNSSFSGKATPPAKLSMNLPFQLAMSPSKASVQTTEVSNEQAKAEPFQF